MRFDLAPLEGVTVPAYRAAHAATFGGADGYVTPFYAPTAEGLSKKDLRELAPFAESADPCFATGIPFVPTVPQLLGNRSGCFLAAVRQLDALGFREVNLNIGCPSGTVTAKRRGAGFLTVPDELDAFFDEVMATVAREMPHMAVSVKTRVGYASEEEWQELLAIFGRYPFARLIVHPRLRADFYNGRPRMPLYTAAEAAFRTHGGAENAKTALWYNGDIFSERDYHGFEQAHTATAGVMLGRGAIADPALFLTLRGEPLSPAEKKKRLRLMHDRMLEENARRIGTGNWLLARMADLWHYQIFLFDHAEGFVKRIRHAGSVAGYRAVVAELFREHDLLPDGAFRPVNPYYV